MTSQEARKKVNDCETQIRRTHNSLSDAARSMGSSAFQEANYRTEINTFSPLIVSLLGIILCFVKHPIWGVLLIIAGIVIAYNTHQSAASIQRNIKAHQELLNSELNRNSDI